MKLTRTFSLLAAVGSALTIGAAMIISGCATPVEIGPTTQPWGTTPSIKPVFPAGPGLPNLPAGFQPCGDYVAVVKLDDGTFVNVRICVYCSSDPNNREVYVQQDCSGNYRPGQRNPNPGQQSPQPPTKQLNNLQGDLSLDSSTISFVVEESFTINPKNLKGASAVMVIGDNEVESSSESRYPAGTKVTIKGDNVGVADLLFWNFGAGSLTAVTDFGNVVQLDLVQTPETGMNVIVRVDGTYLPNAGGMIPWRGN